LSHQAVKFGEIKLIYCRTELMLADALTKALSDFIFANFEALILIQDPRLDKSGNVEDQASAA
jgi:hypothetical protein